ncbi:hypothetical protein F4X33_13650 [Candidatus Poribacteria bacterium]|nr:hypothetical protein [Candidatus Poribacteria bacterium]
MTEAKRRANIKKIQARQRRYHAMGRCWCGREFRPGYKRCSNCLQTMSRRRAKYRETDRCNCGTRLSFDIKPNGKPYKTCQKCRARSNAYNQRKNGL